MAVFFSRYLGWQASGWQLATGFTIFVGCSLVHSLFYTGYLVATVLGIVAIFRLAARRALPSGGVTIRSLPLWAVLALGVILFEFISFKLSSPPTAFWDFIRAYYPAGRAALYHDQTALKDLIGLGAAGGFVNIPVVAYLFAPLGWLSPQIAAVLFTLVSVGSTVIAWFMLVRLARLELRERWLLALLFLTNGPLLSGIKWGNISYLLIFALAAGLLLIRAKRSVAAAVLLGIAAVLKPALALFLIFFLLRRDWRGALGFALTGVATAALSLVLFGWPENLYWLQTSILQYSHEWLAVSGNQSIPAFLFRLHAPPDILLDFSVKAPGLGEKLLARVITGLIFLAAAAACLRPSGRVRTKETAQAETRMDLQYLLTICLCLVCSPLSWAHYYAWLLIPTAFFLGARGSLAAARPARFVGWAAIALTTPLVLWPQPAAPSALETLYASFAVSHHLFGGLLWFGLIAWWLARTGGLLSQAAGAGQLAQTMGVPHPAP
jgi:alpha-1,2-mannosyltransferase